MQTIPRALRVIFLLGVVGLAGRGDGAESQTPVPAVPTGRWQESDSSIAFLRGDHVVWQFNYGPDDYKPHFHPLATVDGRVLTWNGPSDHVWHHALWFSWKYIDGVNYWEHDPALGRPKGRTEVSRIKVGTGDDGSATIAMELSYRPAEGEPSVLDERRAIEVSSPTDQGEYQIDWTATFTAVRDVTLDRAPPQDGSAGGYAGLSVRFNGEFDDREATSLAGPIKFGPGHRYRGDSPAVDYSGAIDGALVGLAFLDHPENPRHPTPWYLIRAPKVGYINAALLNDEPLQLAQGQQLTLRYRLVVHAGRWDAHRLQAAHKDFAAAPLAPASSAH